MIDKWRENFARRYLCAANARRQSGSDTLNNDDILSQALHLYLAADDQDRVNLLLKKYDKSLQTNPSALASLVRFGKVDLAARFLRNHWRTLQCNWPENQAIGRYDEAVATNTAALAAKISDDGQRLIAEIILATMSDLQSLKPAGNGAPLWPQVRRYGSPPRAAPCNGPPTARDRRLLALAARFKTAKFAHRAAERRALLGLLTSDKAAATLADEVAAAYKAFDLALFGANEDFDAILPIVKRHIGNRLSAGDVQAFVDAIKALCQPQNNQSQATSAVMTPMLAVCRESLENDKLRWTIDQSRQVAIALRTACVNRQIFYWGSSDDLAALLALSHVQAGQADELVNWLRQRSRLPLPCLTWDLPFRFETLRKAAGKPSPENLEQRLAYFRDTLRICASGQLFAWMSCVRAPRDPPPPPPDRSAPAWTETPTIECAMAFRASHA